MLGFGCLVAGFAIPFGGIASDFSVYFSPAVSRWVISLGSRRRAELIANRWRLFTYIYAGYVIPTILLMVLGAAIGGAVPNVPAWSAAYESYSVRGVLASMLTRAGGFGKFVVVVLAFSMIGNIGISMYSIALNIQMFLPVLVRVPRSIFSIIVTAILIPVSIEAAKSLSISGRWMRGLMIRRFGILGASCRRGLQLSVRGFVHLAWWCRVWRRFGIRDLSQRQPGILGLKLLSS